MVEMELPKNPTRRQKQPISVPFVWEAKPGTPKNDWKPVEPSRPPPPPPSHYPIKLVASVPFEWEEKPGKPLSFFDQKRTEFGKKNETNFGGKSESKDEKKLNFELFNFQNEELFNSTSSDSIPFEWEENHAKPFHYFPQPTTKFGNKNETNFGNKNESKDEKETIFESLKFVPSQKTDNLTPPPGHHPMKLSASIPFEWEEKPGKPLPFFPLPTKEFQNKTQNHIKTDFESDFDPFGYKTKPNRLDPSPPHPPIKVNGWVPFDADENVSEDEGEVISESDSETLSFHTDESFGSAPSLLANRLMPAVTIAHAEPVLETPTGYESDSSTNSYATGTTSLVGAPFLERLFPLLSPKLSFLEKVECPEEKENSFENHKTKLPIIDSDCESSTIRRPTTLGELIMMSRRRSYIRKAVQIRRPNSMGSTKKEVMGCFMFGINNRIEELQRKMKKQLQLKLI